MKKFLSLITVLALLAGSAFAGRDEKFSGATSIESGTVTLKSGVTMTVRSGATLVLASGATLTNAANETTTGTLFQTSAAAAGIATGRVGNTNPVFRTVNNIASQATGISITGRAVTAGADITVLSSGTNENLKIDAKGSGTVTINGTATGIVILPAGTTIGGSTVAALGTVTSTSANAIAVGPAGTTNPTFQVDASTGSAATGLKVKSAAAAGGLALSAVSSGTDENVTIDAKGAGTLTLNGTATGNTIVSKAQVNQKMTTVSGDGAISIASGIVVLTKAGISANTLAAPSSQDGTRLTIMSNSDNAHVVTFTGTTLLDGTTGANTTATFAAFKGASLTVVAVGATWLVESFNAVTIAP